MEDGRFIFSCSNTSSHYVNIFTNPYAFPATAEDKVFINGEGYIKSVLIEEISFLIKHIRKKWFTIQNVVLHSNFIPYDEVVRCRKEICISLKAIIECINTCRCDAIKEKYKARVLEELKLLTVSVLPPGTFEDEILLKLSHASIQNEKCLVRQYFHTYLETELYFLLIQFLCDNNQHNNEETVLAIVKDLISLTRKIFQREKDIRVKSSFICPCMGQFWSFLQLVTEKYGIAFWKVFNIAVQDEDSLLVFWMVTDLAKMQKSYLMQENATSNYDLIEAKLKEAITSSSTVLPHLIFLERLICDSWVESPRVEMFLILWEFFSKRLNASNKSNRIKFTCLEFNELIDTVISKRKNCDEEFDHFVGLLLYHLKKNPNHWMKIKCRLFSQINPFKLRDLDELGLFRVFELFIALLVVDFEELSKKIVALLGALQDKLSTPLLMNIYSVFLIRHVQDDKSIENSIAPLVKQLAQASENQRSHELIKNFVINFQIIIGFSKSMQLHQWSLIGEWVKKYATSCYISDLETFVNVQLYTIRRVIDTDTGSFWEISFRDHIFPTLKQVSASWSCPSAVGELAAEITSLSPSLSIEAFDYFVGDEIPPGITSKYVSTVLKDYTRTWTMTTTQELLAIQAWIKVCLLSNEGYAGITRNVLKMQSFPSDLKSDVSKSKDPLVTFIKLLGDNAETYVQSLEMMQFCDTCFKTLDRGVMCYFGKSHNEYVILRIYTCVALAFVNCGRLLYNRHKTSSPITRLISCLLFPTEFLIGKISHPFLEAIKKTWHLYFEGILKLNSPNDTYIERILRDLISRYLPLYSVADSPLHNCLRGENTAKVIFEKLAAIYFKHPVKEPETNVVRALKILNECVSSTTSSGLLNVLVNKTLYYLFEVYIFHNQRNLALSTIINVVTSPLYDQVNGEVMKSLRLLTEKHLAFNSKFYFGLINILAKTIPNDIMQLKSFILDTIKKVERMRGIGYDENLRSAFETLNSHLK